MDLVVKAEAEREFTDEVTLGIAHRPEGDMLDLANTQVFIEVHLNARK